MSGPRRFLPLAALVLLLMAPATALALPGAPPLGDDPTPDAPDAVRAVYTTRMLDDLSGFHVDAELHVFELHVAGLGGRTATELRALPLHARDLFEAAVRDAIRSEAEKALGDARVALDRVAFDYGTEDYNDDPYRPAIRIDADLTATFTPQYFGLPPSFTMAPGDLVHAFLASGGTYRLQRGVDVPAGFDVSYIVRAPDHLQVLDGARPVAVYEAGRDNFHSGLPSKARLDLGVRLDPALVPPNVAGGPVVKATFLVDDETPFWKQAMPLLGGDYVGHLELEIQVHSLDVDLFTTNPLPRSLHLDHISADLLRVALREGLVDRDDVQQFFERLIRQSLENGFGPEAQLQFDWPTFNQTLNQLLGGADGQSVDPLRVRATAILPFESNKMFVSSSLGRLVGMTVGTRGDFELSNEGMWTADYTVAYPEGVHVKVRDDEGYVQDLDWDRREGFRVRLPPGASTHVTVSGRSDFHPGVFAVGISELALLGVGAWALATRFRRRPAAPPAGM